MCGIGGVMRCGGGRAIEPAELRRMAAMIRHRGPDGWGYYLDDACGLAHTRLSIIDLRTGQQPLCNEDGTVWVTFNGEVYNYLELREELKQLGHRFRTKSDTETIVHAYEEWGDGAWEKFNGQFAVGLWDARRGELRLARDRVGIAPLHYASGDGAVAFASEAKAIFAGGRVAAEIDPGSLATAFALWAVPAPGTVFKGVSMVPPGACVKVDRSGAISTRVYWRPRFGTPGASRSLEESAAELGERLGEGVRLRLRADVPVAAYLSGGLDSSVITRLVTLANSSPLETFSVRFEDARFDEGPQQHRMAKILGTRHHEVVARAQDIQEALPEVVWHCETPLLRTGPVPMFLLSGLVRRSGIKVVLTGEGADELLAGYDVFKEAKVRRFWARRPESSARPMLLGRIHAYARAAGAGAMWQEFFRRGLGGVEGAYYSHAPRWTNNLWTTRFLSGEVRRHAELSAVEERVSGVMPWLGEMTGWLEKAQSVELVTFMSAYLLSSQGDRVALGHAVEARFPFLDPGVIDLCSTLPASQKLRGLTDKVALRAFASGHLPEDIWRRKKWPYRAPIASALFGEGAPEYVREELGPSALGRSGLLDTAAAGAITQRALGAGSRLGEREEMACVGLLTTQILHRVFGREFAERARALEARLAEHPADVREDRRGRNVR